MDRMFAARSLALVAALSMTLAACDGTDDDAGTSFGATEPAPEALKIGTLLPVTGALSRLGPPTTAGVDLAVREINEAGGVLGLDVEVSHKDSSDPDDARTAAESVTELIDENVSVVVGAASEEVTLDVVDDVTGAQIVQISPASTSATLSGHSEYFFRTAAPDAVQGDVLGDLIISDGHVNVALLVLDEDSGAGLRDAVQKVVEQAGGIVTYGIPGEEFGPTEQDFSTIVGDALATRPDAIALIASATQTPLIVAELVRQGFDVSKAYLVGGSMQDFGDQLRPGTLEGAQGTRARLLPSEEFQGRLLEADPALENFDYAAESYDATMLAALAAVRGGGTDGPTVQANLAAVSGADGGTECSGFAECADLLGKDQAIVYQAVSGAGPLNARNDPSAANVGIYVFDGQNNSSFQRVEVGEVV